MEKEDIISVQRAQEDVETSYNLLNNNSQIWISRQIYAKVSSIKFQIPQKIRPVGAELIHADSRTDSRTDMTTLIGVSLRLT